MAKRIKRRLIGLLAAMLGLLPTNTAAVALTESTDDIKIFDFKLETDSRQYFVNCFMGESMRDARFAALRIFRTPARRIARMPAG